LLCDFKNEDTGNTMAASLAASSGGSGRGRRSSSISINTLSRVLLVCIFFVSLQSFVQLSRLTSQSDSSSTKRDDDEKEEHDVGTSISRGGKERRYYESDASSAIAKQNPISHDSDVYLTPWKLKDTSAVAAVTHDASSNNIPTTTTTLLFTPDEFRAGRIENYINLRDKIVHQLMEQPVPEPTEILLHKAPTPPSGNAILGLASYPTFRAGWLMLVGSLRTNGYEGHIIVGVHPEIPQDERDYLDKMGGECSS
jgi:hypothetical protein